MAKRVVTSYTLMTSKVKQVHRIAAISDLHNEPYADILPLCAQAELLLVAGDLIHRCLAGQMERGLAFLREAAKRLPVYYTYGNHEDPCGAAFDARVRDTGAVLLNSAFCRQGELVIGGVRLMDTARWFHRHDLREIGDAGQAAATRTLSAMGREAGFRLLMCHNPVHYVRYVQPLAAADLTVSGHAHGGQVRILGQGLYAPHQGVLPPWTRGFYDNHRLLVSAGAANKAHLPRLWNPREVLLLSLVPENSAATESNDK